MECFGVSDYYIKLKHPQYEDVLIQIYEV